MKKKFKDTKIGKFLKKNGSAILDVAGDFVPGGKVLKGIASMIESDKVMSPVDKEHALQLINLEIAQAQEITERWKADVSSDSWLSKNVRPLIALYSWVLLTVVVVFMLIDTDIPDYVLSLVGGIAATITAAYFGVREYGKSHTNNK